MTNKTLVRVRVWVSAWIKIYIRRTENTKLLPYLVFHLSMKNVALLALLSPPVPYFCFDLRSCNFNLFASDFDIFMSVLI